MRIKTSYSITTPESAEEGDFSETGWEDEEGEEFKTLDEAIEFLQDNYAYYPSSSFFHPGIWYSTDPEENYETGGYKTLNFHLSGFDENEQETIYNTITEGD